MSMDACRLQQLAAAYGADLRRWPEAEREAARAFLAADPGRERLLFEARQLDAALDASPAPQVQAVLRERVIAAAAEAGLRPRPAPAGRRGLSRWAWLSGAGWAAAGAAGIMIGLASGAEVTRDLQADAVLVQADSWTVDDEEILG